MIQSMILFVLYVSSALSGELMSAHEATLPTLPIEMEVQATAPPVEPVVDRRILCHKDPKVVVKGLAQSIASVTSPEVGQCIVDNTILFEQVVIDTCAEYGDSGKELGNAFALAYFPLYLEGKCPKIGAKS